MVCVPDGMLAWANLTRDQCAHQAWAPTRIGGNPLVARDEGVAHAALAVPLTTPLTCRGVDDIEARVGNTRQIGEHVGQPDCVVEVGAHASLRRDRGA